MEHRVLLPEDEDISSAGLFVIIKESPMDGSWEFGTCISPEQEGKVDMYLTDNGTRLKIWDSQLAKDDFYCLGWDEAKIFLRLCSSPSTRYDVGMVDKVGIGLSKGIINTGNKIFGLPTIKDLYEIPWKQKNDMAHTAMVYPGASPNATELLFSPEDAKAYWK